MSLDLVKLQKIPQDKCVCAIVCTLACVYVCVRVCVLLFSLLFFSLCHALSLSVMLYLFFISSSCLYVSVSLYLCVSVFIYIVFHQILFTRFTKYLAVLLSNPHTVQYVAISRIEM